MRWRVASSTAPVNNPPCNHSAAQHSQRSMVTPMRPPPDAILASQPCSCRTQDHKQFSRVTQGIAASAALSVGPAAAAAAAAMVRQILKSMRAATTAAAAAAAAAAAWQAHGQLLQHPLQLLHKLQRAAIGHIAAVGQDVQPAGGGRRKKLGGQGAQSELNRLAAVAPRPFSSVCLCIGSWAAPSIQALLQLTGCA